MLGCVEIEGWLSRGKGAACAWVACLSWRLSPRCSVVDLSVGHFLSCCWGGIAAAVSFTSRPRLLSPPCLRAFVCAAFTFYWIKSRQPPPQPPTLFPRSCVSRPHPTAATTNSPPPPPPPSPPNRPFFLRLCVHVCRVPSHSKPATLPPYSPPFPVSAETTASIIACNINSYGGGSKLWAVEVRLWSVPFFLNSHSRACVVSGRPSDIYIYIYIIYTVEHCLRLHF